MPDPDSREARMLDLSLKQLLHDSFHGSHPESREGQLVSQVLRAKYTLIVSESIDRFTKSNTKLSLQILALNIILGIFTIAGTVLSLIALYKG